VVELYREVAIGYGPRSVAPSWIQLFWTQSATSRGTTRTPASTSVRQSRSGAVKRP
jgi:hypothetical protein